MSDVFVSILLGVAVFVVLALGVWAIAWITGK